MKKAAEFWIWIFIGLLLFAPHHPAFAAGEPEITGEAAVVIDSKNGQVLYEKNPHQMMYPASTTKILTAIVALENGSLQDKVTIPREACNIEGSAIGLQEGENISMEDLLYAMMLNSGNDTALAIARHVGGTVENFVGMMNQKAAEIGAVDSHFNNPNGLPDPDHYTSAYDMALISCYAMQNPEFRKLVATKAKTISRDHPGAQVYLENHNRMLWRYDGAIGVKTGYTSAARQCLVAAASRDDREMIAVVLKSEGTDVWVDSQKLLDFGFEQFKPVTLVKAGIFIADAPVKFGVSDTVPVQTGNTLTYDFPVDNQTEVRQELFLSEPVSAPVKAGQKLGKLAFYQGDRELGSVDLLAQQEVQKRLSAHWWPWLLLALGLFVLLGIIKHHNRARRKRWEQYRRKYYYF